MSGLESDRLRPVVAGESRPINSDGRRLYGRYPPYAPEWQQCDVQPLLDWSG